MLPIHCAKKPYEKLADGTVKKVEVPYEIPDSWEWVRLKTIYQVINGDRGKNYPSKDKLFENGEIPFINAGNIANEVISSQNLLYLSEEQYNKLGNGKLIKGDVIFCLRGSLGKFGIFNMEKGAIASSLVIIRPYYNNSKDIDIYFSKYLASPVLLSEIRKYNNGTAQPNLSAKALNNFFIPLPPLAEQKRIVAQIERALEKVEAYAESYNKLQELDIAFPDKLKKSILQYAMQGKLVPQDPNDEPVEVLLEKIQTEKQKLYEEGKLKKKDLAEIVVEKGDDNSPYGKNGNFDMDFHRKSNWLLLPLEKVVVSVPTKNHQIKHSDIKSIGMFPVVSQSQVLVEGFSDDKTKVLDNQEHLIIFGDHTRTVKLIDFSFIVGADGVKILQPIGISPQFLKYHLECTILFVKDRGYARHYSYLKNKLIGIPSTDEQNKITNKIDLLFEKVAQL